MRWVKEQDEKLTAMLGNGMLFNEIAASMGVSYRSITNRCNKLGIKQQFTTKIECKTCEKEIIVYRHEERKFCSKSCSVSFTNSNRQHSDATKKKIADKLIGQQRLKHGEMMKGQNNPNWKGGIKKLHQNKTSIIKTNAKEKEVRYCRFCKENSLSNKKIICDPCKMSYYKFYRPVCEFKFDVRNYEDKFDLTLVERYGWYSPSNKGNNLGGVSKDHLYTVRDGFINGVDSEIIKHPSNCVLIKQSENNKKGFTSTITLEELFERIKNW